MKSFRAAILSFSMLAAAVAPMVAQAQASRSSADSNKAYGPQKLVDKAASVVIEMGRDRGIRPLMHQAVGMYIIPEYGRAGFLIGGKGGAGVVVARGRHGWSSPAFFNTGGLSVGLQIGAAGGSIVYLLMDRKAVDAFLTRNKLALDAGAGVSVVTYSDATQAASLKGDAILWTNIRGAYAGTVVGATDIDMDQKRTREYYSRPVTAAALLSGEVKAPVLAL